MGKFVKGAWIPDGAAPGEITRVIRPFPNITTDATFQRVYAKLAQFMELFEEDVVADQVYLEHDFDNGYWDQLDDNTKVFIRILWDYTRFEDPRVRKEPLVNFYRFMLFLYIHDIFFHKRWGWHSWHIICNQENLRYEIDMYPPGEWTKLKPESQKDDVKQESIPAAS